MLLKSAAEFAIFFNICLHPFRHVVFFLFFFFLGYRLSWIGGKGKETKKSQLHCADAFLPSVTCLSACKKNKNKKKTVCLWQVATVKTTTTAAANRYRKKYNVNKNQENEKLKKIKKKIKKKIPTK